MTKVEESSDRIDFRLYTKILYKRRWTIATFFIIVVTLVTISTLIQTPIFEATAIVQIEPAAPEIVPFKDVVTLGSQNFWANKEYYQTQFWIIASEPLARRVVEILDLTRNDPEFENVADPAKKLSRMVLVSPLKNSQLVEISIRHPNPKQAAEICNTLAVQYMQQDWEILLKQEIRDKIIKTLDNRSEVNESDLVKAEENLLNFMKDNGIVSFEGKQNIVQSRLADLSQALTEAQRKRMESQASYQKANALFQSGKGAQLPAVAESLLIQELKEQRILLEKKYSELSQQYQPDYPDMVKLQNQIDLLNSKIHEEIGNLVGSAKSAYLIALEREKELTKAVDEAKVEAQDLNEKAIKHAVLKREVESQSAVYSELVRRSRETKVMQSLTASNIIIRKQAEAPRDHIAPKRKTNVLLAALLGLFGGIGIAFLLEYMDNTIKSQEDLERATGLPFLGIIPSFAAEEPEIHSELFTHEFPKSSITESVRSIRTNIMFSAHGARFRKLLVTSAGPQEGKSTTVINLGIIFAQGGNRVLIIDSDLRRPRIHRAFNVTRARGLTNLIMGEATPEEVIVHSDVPNLAIIPCGPIPPNPSELLGSEEMERVIADLETRFDVILLDSPPIVAVTDAVVLSRKVDGVVLIVKSGKTTTEMIGRARRQLADVRANIMGTVLNDFNIRGEGYKYYYYYRYYRSEGDEAGTPQRVRKRRAASTSPESGSKSSGGIGSGDRNEKK